MKSKEITPKSISTVEAGHVRISAQPESRQESQDRDLVFFSGSGHSFGWVSPISSSVRMFQTSLLEKREQDHGCPLYSQKYPAQGILKNGLLYQPLRSERLILEIDSGWSATKKGSRPWPTPTVCGNHRKGASKNYGDGLSTAVKTWPTPTRSMFEMKDLDAYLERRKRSK